MAMRAPAPAPAFTQVTAVLLALDHQRIDVRAWAVGALSSALARARSDTRPGIERLRHALQDPAIEVRIAATRALGRLGHQAISASQMLLACSQHENERLRLSSILALGRIGREAIPTMIAVLASEHCDARRVAIVALTANLSRVKGSIAAIGVVAALRSALTDEDSQVRIRAAYGLGLLDEDSVEARPELVEALGDDLMRVRHAAAWALDRIPETA